jgi:restriction system protein
LDLPDLHEPLTEVREYLLQRYEKRFDIHPRLFERTVASVFRDLGYRVTLTAYSGDGGIDAVLQSHNETIGVQVKRYRDAIEADQIRSFAGALVLSGQTRGVFITTSRFQKGASSAAELFKRRGLLIELTDSEAFFKKLGLAQIDFERSKEHALSLKDRQFTSLFWGGYI